MCAIILTSLSIYIYIYIYIYHRHTHNSQQTYPAISSSKYILYTCMCIYAVYITDSNAFEKSQWLLAATPSQLSKIIKIHSFTGFCTKVSGYWRAFPLWGSQLWESVQYMCIYICVCKDREVDCEQTVSHMHMYIFIHIYIYIEFTCIIVSLSLSLSLCMHNVMCVQRKTHPYVNTNQQHRIIVLCVSWPPP